QELRLLITKLHPSAPVILGFSWLHSTNSCIDWPSLTLHLDWDNPTNSGLVPFDVSPSSKNSEATIDHSQTPPQLHSRSTWLFIINVQLNDPSKVFPALVDSGASSTFVSNQLGLQHNNLNRPLKLQLFDGSPAMTRITQYHNNTLIFDNNLQFQARLLVTQLPPLTPINRYKGPRYPDQQCSRSPTNSTTTPDSSATTLTSNSVDPGSLNIKIIGAIPFARLLQDGTPAFQLQITPALLKEHLHTGTTMPESKMEEQILSEVVPLEYHEFADVFSEGSAKELPPHHSYNHKIDQGTSPPFGKIYNMSEVKL
ncbi:hypothetical protein C0989_009233, partial [Termitomyces sp. Mn162]